MPPVTTEPQVLIIATMCANAIGAASAPTAQPATTTMPTEDISPRPQAVGAAAARVLAEGLCSDDADVQTFMAGRA